MRSKQFSIGFNFNYDDRYKKENVATDSSVPQQWFNHSQESEEFSAQQLNVQPHFQSLKEEMLDTKWVTEEAWRNLVAKAQLYLNAETIRAWAAADISYLDSGIEIGAPITEMHVVAILLYCDFDELSTAFSRTFRSMTLWETMESVKRRNSNFYHLSKLLKEAVHIWGTCGESSGTTKFWCGLDFKVFAPKCLINLYGPLSTTTDFVVASAFGNNGNGSILRISNEETFYGPKVRFLEVAALSNYSNENERLFFGSRFALRLEGVYFMDNPEDGGLWKFNGVPYFGTLFAFDSLISGRRPPGNFQEITGGVNAVKMLRDLIEYRRAGAIESDLSGWMLDNFDLFCITRNTIILNLWCLDRYVPHSLGSLMTNGLKANAQIDEVEEKSALNMPKVTTFAALETVKTVIIHSTSRRGKVQYPLNVGALLSKLVNHCTNLSPRFTLIIKARAVPEIKYRKVPETIPDLRNRMAALGVSEVELTKFMEKVEEEGYDEVEAIADEIEFGFEECIFAANEQEQHEGLTQPAFEVLERILKGKEVVFPDNPNDDDYESGEEVAVPLIQRKFPKRTWIDSLWRNDGRKFKKMLTERFPGWTASCRVSGKYGDEDHLVVRKKPKTADKIQKETDGVDVDDGGDVVNDGENDSDFGTDEDFSDDEHLNVREPKMQSRRSRNVHLLPTPAERNLFSS